jgi:hypothetical protein
MDHSAIQVGYMNAYHQRIIARARTRRDQLPLLVIRCAVCGHQYGAVDQAVTMQRCPCHDGAAAGIPAEAWEVDWLE